ncbi:MAG: DinB family protein [Acidobacteriia bacterium]|nr:DinB family protein [Terriglobia bacterium]
MPRRTDGVDLAQAAKRTLATNNRVDIFLVENLSDELWSAKVPGAAKTIGALVVHVHNVRCMWVKMLGRKLGIQPPPRLDRSRATRPEAIAALRESHAALARILELGLATGGKVAGFPPDVMHFLGYFLAHDAHHRGQICLLARELGHALPKEVVIGLWQWSSRAKEAS